MEDKRKSGPPSYPPPPYGFSGAAYTTTTYEPGQVITNDGQPGQTVIFRQPHAQPPPKDYVAFAILVTVCCCLPFGIVGIVKAFDARNNYDIGNYAAAYSASRSARSWSIAGCVFGAIWLIIIPLIILIAWLCLPDVSDEWILYNNGGEEFIPSTTDFGYVN